MNIPKTSKPPFREFGEKNARHLLAAFGMDDTHPDYQVFHQLLTRVCKQATSRTIVFRSFGEFILKNTEDARDAKALAAVRALARDMMCYDAAPDIHAIRGLVVAIKERVARDKSVRNLKSGPTVTDEQIRSALLLPTREEQAKRLGLTVRQLQRRLKTLEEG